VQGGGFSQRGMVTNFQQEKQNATMWATSLSNTHHTRGVGRGKDRAI